MSDILLRLRNNLLLLLYTSESGQVEKVGHKASVIFGKMTKTVKLTLTGTFLRDEKLAIPQIPRK